MKKTLIFGILVAMGASLAGCGATATSSNSNNNSQTGANTTASTSGQNTITIATSPTYPPFEYSKDNQIIGFDVAMIQDIAKAENLKVTFKAIPFDGIIPALQSGQVDASVAGMTIKQSRLEAVNFSNAYYKSGLSILTKTDSKISSLNDLKGKVVATEKGTSSVDLLEKNNIKNIKQYDYMNDAYNSLENGGADAIVFDNPSNILFMASHKDVHTVGGLLTGEYYGIAISKKEPDLLKKINAGLAEIQADGDYEKLFDTYLSGDKNGMVKGALAPDSVALQG
jgi:glutamine transport system substrate-binding protein